MSLELCIQILGGFGIIFSILTFISKKYVPLLIFKSTQQIFFAVQYILLCELTGAMMNFIGFTQNITFVICQKKNIKTTFFQALFAIIALVVGIITYKNWLSIIAIIAKVISTIAYGIKNTVLLKSIVLFSTVCWLVYNVIVGSIAGLINDSLTIATIIFSLTIYLKNSHSKTTCENLHS